MAAFEFLGQDAGAVMNHPLLPNTPPVEFNPRLADWVLKTRPTPKVYESHFQKGQERKDAIPKRIQESSCPLWLEIGAGTGSFFESLARLNPKVNFVAIERDRMRGKQLQRRAMKAGLDNFIGIRGNAIPALISGIDDNRVDRIFILYPCPWYKTSQAKNRWYFHPIMSHLYRVLRPGGELVWASDQKFYIDEAKYVLDKEARFETLAFGPIQPNPWNGLESFPEGRSKFERSFLAHQLPCYELVLRKPGA